MLIKIKKEIKKEFDTGTLNPNWVVNIILVPKDENVRMYMDYRDLNRISP